MVRLTKPSPDHPLDEGPKDMLRRHFALVKALVYVVVIMTVVFSASLLAIVTALETFTGYNSDDGLILGVFLMGVSFYIARLCALIAIPVEY